jgi:hypothetical protein
MYAEPNKAQTEFVFDGSGNTIYLKYGENNWAASRNFHGAIAKVEIQ